MAVLPLTNAGTVIALCRGGGTEMLLFEFFPAFVMVVSFVAAIGLFIQTWRAADEDLE